ncbi:MAG TPA: hypothetical protein VFQ39_18745 [Longimicrobium sp.]|nr:hypothetical protein [Longimicrobium sp.]
MRKLKLEVGELTVQSFGTSEAKAAPRGTVRGREGTVRQWSCDGTCDQTCGVPASCEVVNNYCGTYAENGCPNSIYAPGCTDEVWAC